MAGKSNKDKQKVLQERHQAILNDLLKEKCNTVCVDCSCKGPRWASWNLGVFLCIRCAGIHRNLGVHISRVKSVNLDSWTSEQIAMMQHMGNLNAKSVYEANLPANFPVPQTDSALEALIRAKYEYKKYINKDWSPPLHKVQSAVLEPVKKEKKHRNRSLPSRKPQALVKSSSRETSPALDRKNLAPAEKDLEVFELLNLDVPETKLPVDVAIQEFLSLDDKLPADAIKCGDCLVSEFESLDLLDTNSVLPDQTRLANDAIMALYGPSNNAVRSAVPGGLYVAHQTPAFYGALYLNGHMPSSSALASGVTSIQTSNVSGIVKTGTTPATSSLSGSTWTQQPSNVGRTLCTSLWQ